MCRDHFHVGDAGCLLISEKKEVQITHFLQLSYAKK